jgi:hypothetical protein
MSEQNLVDLKVEMTLRVREGGNFQKNWILDDVYSDLMDSVNLDLEDGEEVIECNFTLVEEVDYKKDLKAAIEQLMLYSDNNLVIGADGHKFNLVDKLKELKK